MKAYSIDLRKKIIETYEKECISQRNLAKRFRVSLNVVTRLIKQYRETGELEAKKPPGRERKLNQSHHALVASLVSNQPDITLGELCREVEKQTKIKVSPATMCRVMKRLKLTRKKKALYPEKKASERVQKLRCEYWDNIRDIKVEDLVFIDESGINLGLIRLYAWALKGCRAYGKQPKRGKNVSVVAGLSLKGVVSSTAIFGAFDGLTFEAFVANRLVPNLWPGACVVMDNCSIHKDPEIRRLIEAAGAHLVYLSPYSPDFSPIENFWSKVKSILRTIGARTYPDLLQALESAFSQVSDTDIKHWFTHCCYCS